MFNFKKLFTKGKEYQQENNDLGEQVSLKSKGPSATDTNLLKTEKEFLTHKIDLLEKENHHLKNGLSMIQKNLADSVENSNRALLKLNTVDNSFDSIKSESKEIMENVSKLQNNMEETSKSSYCRILAKSPVFFRMIQLFRLNDHFFF